MRLRAATLWLLVYRSVRVLTLLDAARGDLIRGVCAPTRLQPLSATNAALPRISRRQFSQPPPIPQHPNHLQVIINIRNQCTIIVSLSLHDSFMPCEPCSPATRSF